MPKIDISTIEGFETMSDSEKLAALLELEIPEKIDTAGHVKKELYDRVASELAALKKSSREKLTADEQLTMERDELKARLDELMREKKITDTVNKYMEVGFSKELALSTAQALIDGNLDGVIDGTKLFNAEVERQRKLDIEKQLKPNGGSTGTDEAPEVALARKLGKASAESKASSDKALEHYTT